MIVVSATKAATNPATKAATYSATAATIGSSLVAGYRACLVAGRRVGRRGQLMCLDGFVSVFRNFLQKSSTHTKLNHSLKGFIVSFDSG